MSKEKARLCTAVFCTLFFGLMFITYLQVYASRLLILGAFAIIGAMKFVRIVFLWLTEDRILPKKQKKHMKTYAEIRDGK